LQTFSNNIYNDLSIEDLKSEYLKTKNELNDFKGMPGLTPDENKAM